AGVLTFSTVVEHPRKYLVDMAELPPQIESALNLLGGHTSGDFLIGQHQLVKVEPFFPGTHGVALDQAVSVLAGNSVFDQIKQQLPAEDEAAGAVEVRLHALWVDEHGFDQVRGFPKQVIDERRGVGQDDAFRRRV